MLKLSSMILLTTSSSSNYSEVISITVLDVNEAPRSLSLSPSTRNIIASTDTSVRVKVADIIVEDDALGTNTLSLSGADASDFIIDGTELFLAAGATGLVDGECF